MPLLLINAWLREADRNMYASKDKRLLIQLEMRKMIRKDANMNKYRKAAIVVGILIIIGTVAGILSVVPVIDGQDYLEEAIMHKKQVLVGGFFQFVMVVAYVGFPIAIYPVVKKYKESLALGSVAFCIIAGVFIIIGVMILVLLLELSQEFTKAGGVDSLYFQTLGTLLRAGRDFVNHVAMIIAYSLGSLIINYIFYQLKLIPEWLSGWGLVGAIMSIIASLLFMFHIVDLSELYLGLNVPKALQELVLAGWLIIKGFNSEALDNGK